MDEALREPIVLGFGNNVDYEVEWDSAVIERLIAAYEIDGAEPVPDAPIRDERDLVRSLLSFLRSGTGGERYVESPRTITDFADRFRYRTTLGGTAVRAAIAMHAIGRRCALHLVTINDAVRHGIPTDCHRLCSNDDDTVYPHLIMQFDRGRTVTVGAERITAPAANRIIYVNDPDNAAMRIHPGFAALARDARVVLVSGFNAVRDRALLEARIGCLVDLLRRLPPGCIVMYEDGGFHDPALAAVVNAALADRVTIHSLNEDEWARYLGHRIDLSRPEVAWHALQRLARTLAAPTLVVHTARWAALYGTHSARHRAAIRSGVVMATTRLRNGDALSASSYRRTASLEPNAPDAWFAARLNALGGGHVHCVPSFAVPEHNVTTIGLGDAFVGGFIPALIEG